MSVWTSAYCKYLRDSSESVERCAIKLLHDAQFGGRESMAWVVFDEASMGIDRIDLNLAYKAAEIVMGKRNPGDSAPTLMGSPGSNNTEEQTNES